MSLRIPKLPCLIPVKEVSITEDGEIFFLLSSNVLTGFVLGGRVAKELYQDIPRAIGVIYQEAMGVDVNVHRVASAVPNESLWKVEARQ